MARNALLGAAVLLVVLFGSACVASPEDDGESIGVALSAALNGNALNGNALNGNALNGNALNGNGLQATSLTPAMLGANALRPSALSAEALAAIQDPGSNGDLSRELLKYAVSCALGSSQAFEFSWVDTNNNTHNESYPGLLGLALGWASDPLTGDGQRWISACLISRVNYFGVSVLLSSRGATSALTTTADERAEFTMLEGAFWGNLFSATPTAYACHYTPNEAHSRAADRVCAAGYIDGSGTVQSCSIIQWLGSCATACGSLTDGQYYSSCSSDAGQSFSTAVITVFLQ